MARPRSALSYITPCMEPNCYEMVHAEGRCYVHYVPTVFAGSTRRERLPKDWPVRRKIVLQRDGYTCYLCGSNTPPADGVDHIDAGDDHGFENLKAVHHNKGDRCHYTKTAHEGNNSPNRTDRRRA